MVLTFVKDFLKLIACEPTSFEGERYHEYPTSSRNRLAAIQVKLKCQI